MKSYLPLDLESPPPNAIWVYLKQKRERKLCFKKPLKGEYGTKQSTWLLTMIPV